MKKLTIPPQQLLRIAVFMRLRMYFNLDEEKLAKTMRHGICREIYKDPVQVIADFKRDTLTAFRYALLSAEDRMMGCKRKLGISSVSSGWEIETRFRLCPAHIIRDIETDDSSEGIDRIAAVRYLQLEMPRIVTWTFDRAIEILEAE